MNFSQLKSIFTRTPQLMLRVATQPKRAYWIARGIVSLWKRGGFEAVRFRFYQKTDSYSLWYRNYAALTHEDRQAIQIRIESLKNKPLLSIILPVYNVDDRWLRLALDSVVRQLYPHWELCIADDCSTLTSVRTTLEEYQRKDSRIKVLFRPVNGHISEASNSALSLATGEFAALLDHDDELTEHALYMIAEELNTHPTADLIYSDQDGIDSAGKLSQPYFKPDWNPDLFYSQNYLNHFCAYRLSTLKEINGFQKGMEGSQDYDLALRFIEHTTPERIRHIPHVLYHWRAIPGSVALAANQKNYAHERARLALRAHLKRIGVAAEVTEGFGSYHRLRYPLPEKPPKVSLIIGTRDRAKLLKGVVNGILNRTDYPNFELIILDNQSTEPEILEYFTHIKQDPRVRVLLYDAPFNFSAMNNFGVRHASGSVIGLLNNDLEIISPDWLTEMVSQALRPEIGAVGAKLYYANNTIQHAGVILGVGQVAGHAHKNRLRSDPGYFSRNQVVSNFSAVTAACIVLRRDIFDEVGGLDEANLAVAFNDIDLCMKIGQKGYRIVFTPYAELYHLESASRGSDMTAKMYPRFLREQNFMIKKWGGLLLHDPCYSPNLTLESEDFTFAFPPRALKPWQARPASSDSK